uniref:FERM domain-containing protein n=1 Tax=Ascaris lumbricoides TaxID=6252 RepID=A0A0M3IL32_ASCLU
MKKETFIWTDKKIDHIKLHQLQVDSNNYTTEYIMIPSKSLAQLEEFSHQLTYETRLSLCKRFGYTLPFPKQQDEFDFLARILRLKSVSTSVVLGNRFPKFPDRCFFFIVKKED